MREQYTREEFATALLNLEWLTKNPRDRDDGLHVDSWTYIRAMEAKTSTRSRSPAPHPRRGARSPTVPPADRFGRPRLRASSPAAAGGFR
jgi:hypothetical protein